jgi:hypothetical protein
MSSVLAPSKTRGKPLMAEEGRHISDEAEQALYCRLGRGTSDRRQRDFMGKKMKLALPLLSVALFCVIPALAEDLTGQIKKAVEKITLDQPGTKPFHLKADKCRALSVTRTRTAQEWWRYGGNLRPVGGVR